MENCKISFYEDYVEALMEFCEKRSNAPKSEEEQSTEQEQNHSEAFDEHSELAEQSQQLELSKYIFLDDHCIDVKEVYKTLNEIEELKCLLDHQVITEKEFYIKCDKLIRSYDMPF